MEKKEQLQFKNKNIHEDYILITNVLYNFHNQCLLNDLPINLMNPVFVGLDFILIGRMAGNEDNIELKLLKVCDVLEKFRINCNNSHVFLMYSIVKYIDDKFEYFNSYKEPFIRATEESSNDSDEDNYQEYWLTAWKPSRIMSDVSFFYNKVEESKLIWDKECDLLRKALYSLTFMPPYNGIKNSWAILRMEDSLPIYY
jgi:hypothetical protein